MKRGIVFLGLVLFIGYAAVSTACGASGTVTGASDDGATSGIEGIAPASQSTGGTHILNGNGCPDGYTYVRAGGSYGGCRFEPKDIKLYAYCDPSDEHYTRSFNRGAGGALWRSDSEPSERGLQVFWPGGDGVDGKGFACVKERWFDCD